MNKDSWHDIFKHFADGNIYQTWSYEAIRSGSSNMSHLVLKLKDTIVAAAQARILNLPPLRLGVAYIRWAPLLRASNLDIDLLVYQQALRAFRNEYVCRRGLILRIFPLLYDNNEYGYREILAQEGYNQVHREKRSRTILMDISPPVDEIRKALDQKWRNCLNRAERNNLEVIRGTSDNLFVDFIELYKAMLDRKKFQEPNDINEFRLIQKALPLEHKMQVFICKDNKVSSAGGVVSAIGDTGLYLFGATNNIGMINKGSYLIQWNAIHWMKEVGCVTYNLNGINPVVNPGSYHFKVGLSGKNCRDLLYLGRYDCYSDSLKEKLMDKADMILPIIRKARKWIGKRLPII